MICQKERIKSVTTVLDIYMNIPVFSLPGPCTVNDILTGYDGQDY
jgi:hypothetical protein